MYQVYPLESSSPDHLAGLLERLVQETVTDKDGKIERITPKTQEQIAIVPDPNTFSLIVYASQKSQKWIEALITRLDKRRPQVLIDVTLVEITRADTFEYDLSLVAANAPVIGNLVVDPVQTGDSASRLEGGFNLLDDDGNPTGRTRAFYNDEHVQALLTAMQQKNYGRVLAKPKVLVDDGREGQIVTTDTTTYVKESIQIPQTGTAITTREFVPIDASIELKITPHISEGNLLRLDVFMSRDDFGTRPLSGAPGHSHQQGHDHGVRAGRPYGDPGRLGEAQSEQGRVQGADPRRYPSGWHDLPKHRQQRRREKTVRLSQGHHCSAL